MLKPNPHFNRLQKNPIFVDIEEEKKKFKGTLVDLGVGDVSKPLAPAIIEALTAGCREMGKRPIGYGPSTGYDFLREAIFEKEYKNFGFTQDNIFISDGINTDVTHLFALFGDDIAIGIPDPGYPAYKAAAIVAGYEKIFYLPCTAETGFLPRPPSQDLDLIILCSPHNPTGVAFTKEELKEWVLYAQERKALILYDSAYASFMDEPFNVYEIDGACEVIIEMKSFSKSYGFTGLRCSYTVVPMEPYRTLWERHQNVMYNGLSYPVQKAAYTALSLPLTEVADYKHSGRLLREELEAQNQEFVGGLDAPYIWWKVPEGETSFSFFQFLLHKCALLAIPGTGFGIHGEGYVRLSTFTSEPERAIAHLRRGLCVSM